MDQIWDKYRRNSKGWKLDPVALIHPRIILGSCESLDINTMSQYNITHVVNCAEDRWGSNWFKKEFPNRYACINAIDDIKEDITKWYPAFENVMNKFLLQDECKTIYVHCQCGINRSAFLLLIYSCLKFGYDIETSAKNIVIQRPCAFTNPSFRNQAIQYIKKHR